jgi:hypothetical protein
MVSRPIFSRYKTEEYLIIWKLFLDHLARKCIQQVTTDNLAVSKNRRDLLIKTKQSQEKLMHLFSTYQSFCGQCQDCCHIDLPLRSVDCYLYKLSPDNSIFCQVCPPKKLLRRILRLSTPDVIKNFIRNLVTRGKQEETPLIIQLEDNDYPICPMLTDEGCWLPWGRRPMVCPIFLCKQLRDEMSRRDYGRYLSIVIGYLTNLTIGLTKLWLELRCSNPCRDQ